MENFANEIVDIYEHTMSIKDLYQRDIESTLEALQYCIQGVEDNNKINGGKWSEWTAEDIMDTYLSEPIDIPLEAIETDLSKFRDDPAIRDALHALIIYMTK